MPLKRKRKGCRYLLQERGYDDLESNETTRVGALDEARALSRTSDNPITLTRSCGRALPEHVLVVCTRGRCSVRAAKKIMTARHVDATRPWTLIDYD